MPIPAVPSRPATVLVIDDEPDNFDVVEALLYEENYDLHYASSGENIFARLARVDPDVLLLDVMMPDVDGLALCHQIRSHAQWRNLPIIMVTALTNKEDLAACLEAGADDFISKPVNKTELKARIHSILRIKAQYDDLQALLRLQEDMMHMVVHDLRNPLTVVALAAGMLQLPNLKPEMRQQKVEQITLSVQRLQSLIDSILLMAKLQTGKLTLDYTPIDLQDYCADTIEEFQTIAREYSVSLRLVFDEASVPLTLALDKTLFRRILDNLIANALKFSPPNGTVTLRVYGDDQGSTFLAIQDEGPGVDPKLQEQIFERYEIGAAVQHVAQLGLGLAFCKLAIEAHGGNITVANNETQGSTFTVCMPLQSEKAAYPDEQSEARNVKAASSLQESWKNQYLGDFNTPNAFEAAPGLNSLETASFSTSSSTSPQRSPSPNSSSRSSPSSAAGSSLNFSTNLPTNSPKNPPSLAPQPPKLPQDPNSPHSATSSDISEITTDLADNFLALPSVSEPSSPTDPQSNLQATFQWLEKVAYSSPHLLCPDA
ncbi:MAG: hybrid sensor histidine kinase/response regulator [Prochlorothrix sp.]|nr:hybrid sensor histidine kinase/response regulator [Prochlorothrix sp.]